MGRERFRYAIIVEDVNNCNSKSVWAFILRFFHVPLDKSLITEYSILQSTL